MKYVGGINPAHAFLLLVILLVGTLVVLLIGAIVLLIGLLVVTVVLIFLIHLSFLL